MPCWFVLVGSGYLHTLNLVSLIGVSWLVWLPACLEPRALLVCAGWKWLPTCLEPCVLAGWCVPGLCPGWCGYLHALNLVSWLVWLVVCPGWKWLPACLEPRALLVRAWLVWLPACFEPCACWFVCLVVCPGWKWLPAYLEPCVPGSCLAGSCWLEVVTCIP